MRLLDILAGKNKQQHDDEFINLIRALDNGEEWAQKKINELWENNDQTLFPRMDEARIVIYEQAAKQGNPKAQYWMGLSLRGINKQESLKWLMPLAEQGDTDVMKVIASGYTEYGGYGDDSQMYYYWNMKAAKAGDAEAQATIGLKYLCESNIEEALKWYQLSADQGHPDGYLGVAKCYKDIQLQWNLKAPATEENIIKNEEYDLIIEEAYLCAIETAQKESQSADAFDGLGHLYYNWIMFPKRKYEDEMQIVKLAAYNLYVAYLQGYNHNLQQFNELVRKFHLSVDTNDIQGWAQHEGLLA